MTELNAMPLLVASAMLATLACIAALMLRGAVVNARRTILGIILCILALNLTGAAFFADKLNSEALQGDIGLTLATCGLAGLLTVAGLLERIRPSAAIMCAALSAVALTWIMYPLQPLFGTVSATAMLFGLLIVAGTAHLVLLTYLTPHPARFTREGAYRIAGQHYRGVEWLMMSVLAISLALLGWRLKAFDGVDTVFHVYGTLIACVVSAFAAGFVSLKRHQPEALLSAALAVPAGALLVSAIPAATPSTVVLLAIPTGIASALAREALISMRIDDPSYTIAALTAPAIIAWLAPGLLAPAVLASAIQLLAFWLIGGVLLGCVLAGAAQLITGLRASDRAIAEGMDARLSTIH